MDPRDEISLDQIEALSRVFSEQLLTLLDECARGRLGLFGEPIDLDEPEKSWPEASSLRELGLALQSLFAAQGERNALVDEFLDLCTMHGESHPGERRLARMFLERIERGQVGVQGEEKPW